MTLALSDVELAAVTSVWTAKRRELTASFGGTSMLPTIVPGERLLLHCGVEPLVGDVAAYVLHDQVVVHRIVALSREEGWFLAWGDANALPDPPFRHDQLIGTVSGVERLIAAPPRSVWRRALVRAVAGGSGLASVERRLTFFYRCRARWNRLTGRRPAQ